MDKRIKIPPQKAIDTYCPNCLYKEFKDYYDSRLKDYEKLLKKEITLNSSDSIIPEDKLLLAKNTLESQEFETAKSESMPHQYCSWRKWKGNVKLKDIVTLIRIYGKAEMFHGKPYQMLYIGDFKYWTLGFPLEAIANINRTLIRDCTREELELL